VHAQLTNALVKVASRIGVDRRSRNVTPTLKDYLDDQTADDESVTINEEAVEVR
jgi:hypothetical protein